MVGLLPAEEIIPVLGRPQKLADVIVLTTEQIPGYDAHFKAVMLLVQTLKVRKRLWLPIGISAIG